MIEKPVDPFVKITLKGMAVHVECSNGIPMVLLNGMFESAKLIMEREFQKAAKGPGIELARGPIPPLNGHG